MSEAIPVGNSLNIKWVVAFGAISLSVILGGAAYWNVDFAVAVSVVIFGVVWFVVALVTGMVVLHQQRWVQVTDGGFTISDRRGVREFRDAEVSTISLESRTKYRAGQARALKYTCILNIEGLRAEQIKLVYTVPLHAPDPLEGLRERILHNLHRRAEEHLQAGNAISGRGWSLTLDELTVATPVGIAHVALDDVAAVDTFDACLCIWKRGSDIALARIPLGTPNVPVLEKVLYSRLDPAVEDAEESGRTGLGRLLFERRTRSINRVAVYVAACLLGVVTAIALMTRTWELVLVLGLCWLLMGATAWHVLMVRGVGIFCHQFGIRKQPVVGSHVRIRFTELNSFTFQETRQFLKGYYSGTTFSLTFAARGGKSVVYSVSLRNQDEELLYLRETVSLIMAREMSRMLRISRTVAWTSSLTLTPHALEYRKWGLFSRQPTRLAYDDISGVDLSDTQLRVWIHGRKSPVVTEKNSVENFFPGYLLFNKLLHAPVDEVDSEVAAYASGGSTDDDARTIWISDDSGANR